MKTSGIKLPKFIEPREIGDLITAAKRSSGRPLIGARNAAIVALAAECGLRRAEIVGLKISDIDWAQRRLLVMGKGRKERYVLVSDSTLQLLKSYLTKRGPNTSEFLFLAHRKRPMSYANMARIWKKLSEVKPELKNHSIHHLRHSFAVRAIEGGVPLNVLQQLLGHSSIQTTSIYTKITLGHAEPFYRAVFK